MSFTPTNPLYLNFINCYDINTLFIHRYMDEIKRLSSRNWGAEYFIITLLLLQCFHSDNHLFLFGVICARRARNWHINTSYVTLLRWRSLLKNTINSVFVHWGSVSTGGRFLTQSFQIRNSDHTKITIRWNKTRLVLLISHKTDILNLLEMFGNLRIFGVWIWEASALVLLLTTHGNPRQAQLSLCF